LKSYGWKNFSVRRTACRVATCGWEGKDKIPGEWTFFRAFAHFSRSRLQERVHEALINKSYAGEIVGHISGDFTAIEAREKPIKKASKDTKKKEPNPRRNKALKEALANESKRRDLINLPTAEDQRYNERSTVERVNGRLKDDLGGRVAGSASKRSCESHVPSDVWDIGTAG
jgi:hypothetical protein